MGAAGSGPGRVGRAALAAVCLALSSWAAPPPGTAETEYEIKAALIYKIAKFVQWPSSAFEDAKSPFVLAILGEDPFGPRLDEMLDGRTLSGRKLKIARFAGLEDLGACHALFVTKEMTGRMAELLERLGDGPVLLIGEKTRFAHNGGVINFKASKRSRIQFEINPAAASQRKLEINPELLKLGDVIR